MEVIEIDPKKLKIGENSRWRADANLSELMESIKQTGIMQPIIARKEDSLVICGNRRLAAALKLNFEKVPVIFKSGVTDKQMMVQNLTENIQRQDISSIEIGRMCDILMKESKFNMSINELAVNIGITVSRVKACLEAFKRLPPEFRSKVKHLESTRERKFGELPEQIVKIILNFSRTYKKLDDYQLKVLLKKAMNENLTGKQIGVIGRLYNQGMAFRQALTQSENYHPMHFDYVALKTELEDAMKKEKVSSGPEFIRKLIKEKYPNLIF